MRLVHMFGFSYGWDELALKKPPPLVPSSLMASWEATGPPMMVCSPPATVATVVKPEKFCATPNAMRMVPITMARGMRMRNVPRMRSTQKLPIVSERRSMKPRTRAMDTAMPTAAETKFCTHRPAIWTE